MIVGCQGTRKKAALKLTTGKSRKERKKDICPSREGAAGREREKEREEESFFQGQKAICKMLAC